MLTARHLAPHVPKHLHRYANEATMRLYIGNCDVETIDRMIALIGQIGGRRLSYMKLIKSL